MARFNKTPQKPQPKQPLITTNQVPTLVTGNKAPAFERDTLSELYLLGITNFVGMDTFYEKGAARDRRYMELIRAAVTYDENWVGRYLKWLRTGANMRTASLVGAVEAARRMVEVGIPGGRYIISSVLQRADEPGEMLAYWLNNYSRSIPKPIKRGIADAVARLYDERSTLKYDTSSKALRFGTVLELCHPSPSAYYQRDLFKHLVSRSRGRDEEIPETLTVLRNNKQLRQQAAKQPELLLDSARLRAAGMTWEAGKSLAGDKVKDRDFWREQIPNMPPFALLRNLRNFEQAQLANDSVDWVKQKLQDPAVVAKSGILPLQILSAYRNTVSDQWKGALARMLELSLQSVPELPGRTLVLVDTSGSMAGQMTDKSELRLWDAAATFGIALAARQRAAGHQVDVVSYASRDQHRTFPEVKGETLLQSVTRFKDGGWFLNGSTDTAGALRCHYKAHDRAVILTDEQCNMDSTYYGVGGSMPADKMLISFNLAGYKPAQMASGPFRITVGGLTDAAFTMIPTLENGATQRWPF